MIFYVCARIRNSNLQSKSTWNADLRDVWVELGGEQTGLVDR